MFARSAKTEKSLLALTNKDFKVSIEFSPTTCERTRGGGYTG